MKIFKLQKVKNLNKNLDLFSKKTKENTPYREQIDNRKIKIISKI